MDFTALAAVNLFFFLFLGTTKLTTEETEGHGVFSHFSETPFGSKAPPNSPYSKFSVKLCALCG